ncbi:MAG: hypothetical protein ACFFD2_10395 [Promethearchaeota archaeon]
MNDIKYRSNWLSKFYTKLYNSITIWSLKYFFSRILSMGIDQRLRMQKAATLLGGTPQPLRT